MADVTKELSNLKNNIKIYEKPSIYYLYPNGLTIFFIQVCPWRGETGWEEEEENCFCTVHWG